MQKIEVTFRYKGDRDYIQGPDMFNMFMRQFSEKNINMIRFSVHGFIKQVTCELYVSTDKTDLDKISGLEARCQGDVDGVLQYMGLKPSSVPGAEAGRYAYDEADLIRHCHVLEDGITLQGQSPFSFIETIVAMKKKLMESMFSEVEGKWVFTRIDLPQFCNTSADLEIQFKHNMNFRILKSDILLNGDKVGDLYFSLVK